MNCLYYDEEKKQCVNPYCFYKGTDCPVKACKDMCKLYEEGSRRAKLLIKDLRHCVSVKSECMKCSMVGTPKCYNGLMKNGGGRAGKADEGERVMVLVEINLMGEKRA